VCRCISRITVIRRLSDNGRLPDSVADSQWFTCRDVLTVPCLDDVRYISEEEAAAIRAAFDSGGEFATAIELRRRFPGISDNEQARQCAKTIAGWKSVNLPPLPPVQLRKMPKSHPRRGA
jgi:hypothetical protein